MKYILDTNICIYLIKKQPASVLKKFKTLQAGDVGISSVTAAELWYGVFKSHSQQKNRIALNEFMLPLEVQPFDEFAAEQYGEIRAHLEKKGKPIGSLDFMIAAHALSLKATLVTNNQKEFMRISGLKVENWVS